MNTHKAYGILYGGFNTRRYTLVHGFCLFKLLPIGCMLLYAYLMTPLGQGLQVQTDSCGESYPQTGSLLQEKEGFTPKLEIVR